MQMKKTFTSTILFIITIVCILYVPTQKASGKLISFTPILRVYVDTSNLENPIQPEREAVNVPIRIEYSLPPLGLPQRMKQFLFFGLHGIFITPPIKVHLEVLNKPDWLDASIATPDIYLTPELDKPSYANTTLSISVYKDAPARSFTITLYAKSEALGNVLSQDTTSQFKIQVGYIPLVTITTKEPIKEAGPMTTLTYPVEIRNNANKETRVRLISIDQPPGWAVKPAVHEVTIPRNGSATLAISVVTPYGFGWIPGETKVINMKFIALPVPLPETYEETPTNTYLFSIGVRSGSTPMLGLVGGIIAAVVIIAILVLTIIKRKFPIGYKKGEKE